MAITDIPIFSMLRTRMQYAQQRQQVLAENVSNADTPNYRAHDLVAPKFPEPTAMTTASVARVTLAQTERWGNRPAGVLIAGDFWCCASG